MTGPNDPGQPGGWNQGTPGQPSGWEQGGAAQPGGWPQGVPMQPVGYPTSGFPPYYAAPRKTNGLALAAMIVSLCSLFMCQPVGIVGAIMGHKARPQLRERGEEGDAFALTGVIVGWISFVIGIFGLIITGLVIAAILNDPAIRNA